MARHDPEPAQLGCRTIPARPRATKARGLFLFYRGPRSPGTLAAIDTGPVEDALRKHRELRTALACQQANARKVSDFVRSFRGT